MISNFISFKKKILNKKIEKIFFYLMWIGIISSINTNSSLLYLKSYQFFEIINFLRALAPLIIFIILSLYLLINIKNLNFFKNRNIYLNIACICVFFYSLISIFGLFLNNEQFLFDRIWWHISYLNVLIYLYLVSVFFSSNFLKHILFILLLFIFCFYTIVASTAIKEIFILKVQDLYHSPLLGPRTFILDQGLPRTSGVARALFFLFLSHLSFLCFNKKHFYINLFFCLLYAFIVSLFESRITTIFYFISLLVIFYSKFYFLKKILIFAALVLIFSYSQLIFYSYIYTSQTNNIENSEKKTKVKKRVSTLFPDLLDNSKVDKKDLNVSKSKKTNADIYKNFYTDIIFFQKPFYCNEKHFLNEKSSGRLCIWTDNLNTALKNYNIFIFGQGAQADRYNVRYLSLTQENSASNSLIYVLTSGGVISVIIILVIYYIFFLNFLKYFLFSKNKLSNESSILIACLLMNSFILFRGITESSFAVFSLDYILFLITTFIIFSNKSLNYDEKKSFYEIKK